MNNQLQTTTALSTIAGKMALRFNIEIDSSKELVDILKQTCFKQKETPVTDMQLYTLMIIAEQYNLNPWTREIYAYPDKGGIVPVVGVDGWTRIANDHPKFSGIEYRYSDNTINHKNKLAFEWIECAIYRTDMERPIVVREYFDEVCRSVNFTTPWDTHPKRMHRHKATIQAIRLAFGFSGIYDDEDAQIIVEKEINPIIENQSIIESGQKFEETLLLIEKMDVSDFKSIDPNKFNDDQKKQLRAAMTARKKAIKEAAIVGTISKTETVKKDWETDIKECGDGATLTDLLAEMTEKEKETYEELINDKYDSFIG